MATETRRHGLRSVAPGTPDVSQRGSVFPSELVVVLIAAIIFLSGVISPPSLMDDVDATQAQIARTMLDSGDWVTAHIDGVRYLEKAPLKYWVTAGLFAVFGVRDWVARLPTAITLILLCWIVFRMGKWAHNADAGFCGGLVLATSIGLFLFTRIIIPDVILTLLVTLALWTFLRAMEEKREHSLKWSLAMFASMALAVLVKGFIGVVFPAGIVLVYLAGTKVIAERETWRRLHLLPGFLLFLLIALPWHVLAILHNPPFLDFTLHAEPHFGEQFHGFFWFYFINEQVLRFLNGRWPRDYNTVPVVWFWLYHLVWFFPWSILLPAVFRLSYRSSDRASKLRFLALCWIGVVMVFFTFSTTQEYYSMPIYPAVALLLGFVMTQDRRSLRLGMKVAAVICGAAFLAAAFILVNVRSVPTPGDISVALSQNPDLYTLSLGHMSDLTLRSFAYLRAPLQLAALAFLIGAIAPFAFRNRRLYLATAIMLLLFFQAARLALTVFDPYLSSRGLAEVLKRSPEGVLIINGAYYPFSSVVFYANRPAFLLNGRVNNLEYGSYAPDAPRVFIDNQDLQKMWNERTRCYLVSENEKLPAVQSVLGREKLFRVAEAGGKSLFSNSVVAPASTRD